MRENALKTRLKNGQTVYGMLAPNYDPSVVEIIGHLGFECYMLDCEHGAAGPIEAEHVVRACETVDITPLARVRSTDPKLVLQFLDTGVMGVMMPGIMDADDVKRLVEAVKYPPLGRRGIAPVRSNDYLLGQMPQAEYVRFSNEQTLVLPQIETMQAVKNLDSLVRVEGVDGFIVGPRDLSMAMGFPDGPAHDEVRQMIDHIFGVVRGAGLAVGTVAATGEQAKDLTQRGAQIILCSVIALLRIGTGAFFSAARRQSGHPTSSDVVGELVLHGSQSSKWGFAGGGSWSVFPPCYQAHHIHRHCRQDMRKVRFLLSSIA